MHRSESFYEGRSWIYHDKNIGLAEMQLSIASAAIRLQEEAESWRIHSTMR